MGSPQVPPLKFPPDSLRRLSSATGAKRKTIDSGKDAFFNQTAGDFIQTQGDNALSGTTVHPLTTVNPEVKVDLYRGPRISSCNQPPARFNRWLQDTRLEVVKAMVYSSYKAVEREMEAEQERLTRQHQKEQEAALRNKRNVRRQLLRGQELDQVQTSVVNYDFSSSRNAEVDQQLAKSMLSLLTFAKTRNQSH